MTPETAALANEAFYKINTFKVDVRNYALLGPPPLHELICWHPPNMFERHIRKIDLCLEPDIAQWYHIDRIAQVQYPMSNLKRVDSIVNDDLMTQNSMVNFRAATAGAMSTSKCKGFVRFYHKYSW